MYAEHAETRYRITRKFRGVVIVVEVVNDHVGDAATSAGLTSVANVRETTRQ